MSAWQKVFTADGRPYYQNPETRETRWKKPAGWVDPEETATVAVSEMQRIFSSNKKDDEVEETNGELLCRREESSHQTREKNIGVNVP